MKINDIVKQQLVGDLFEVLADDDFARDIIEECADIPIPDPPEFKHLKRVGQLCGTELYVDPRRSFAPGSLAFMNQHNAIDLGEFLHLMQMQYIQQAQVFMQGGYPHSAAIVVRISQQACSCVNVEGAGQRGLWFA